MFTLLNGGDLSFDVLNEQLVPVPLGHRKHTLKPFQLGLLLGIHAMERQLFPTLAGLDQLRRTSWPVVLLSSMGSRSEAEVKSRLSSL